MATDRLRNFTDGTDGNPAMPGSAPLMPTAAAPLPMLTASMAPPPTPVAGPRTAGQILGVGARSVADSLKNVYGSGNSFGDATSPDFSQAMNGNPALLAANTAPPATPSPLAPAPTAASPLATQSQVRAVDNQPANAAAIAAPAAPAPLGGGPMNDGLRLGYIGAAGVNSADRTGQMGRDTQSLRDMTQRSIELANQGVGQATPGLGVINGGFADRNTDFNLQADLRNAMNRTTTTRRGTTTDPSAEVLAGQIKDRTRLREMSLQNEGRLTEARMRDSTDRRGQDLAQATANMRDSTDRRGQDVTLQGQQMTAKTAANAARLSQMNSDRQFGLEAQKFGNDVAKTNYEQRKGAEDAYDKELSATFRTKDDKGNDVADTAKVAQFKSAANTTISAMIDKYKQSPDPKHQKMAADLESKGFAALDKKDKEELQQLFERRNRMEQSAGRIVPGSANFRQSDNLLDYRQAAGDAGVDRRLIGGDRLRTAGGGDVSVNDLRYADGPANTFFPDFKRESNDLTRGLRGFK